MTGEEAGTRPVQAEAEEQRASGMTTARSLAIILVVAGAVLVLVSVFAHQLGLGPNPAFGWKKLSGTVLGVALVVAGVLLWRAVAADARADDDAGGDAADGTAGSDADTPTEARPSRGIE